MRHAIPKARRALAQWREAGAIEEIGGQPVFYRDVPARQPGAAPPLLILHGFPSSSFDFHRCLPMLSARRRVVVHDHLGFGFSAKPKAYSYSLIEQAEVAMALWRRLGIESADLLAHDYGTSVTTELLAQRARDRLPLALRSVTLCNGSVHLELARLRLAQRLARSPRTGPWFGRLVPGFYIKRVLRRLWGEPAAAQRLDLDAIWLSIRRQSGHRRSHQISSYLDERVRFRHRWVGALEQLDRPVHLLWGQRDPIAVPAVAERLAAQIANAELTWLPALGHYPMLEDAEAWGHATLRFLDRKDRDGA